MYSAGPEGFFVKASSPPECKAASTCELVSSNENIQLSYIKTNEQRDGPLATALPVQKWKHALDLLSIASQQLPDACQVQYKVRATDSVES